ncbi:hypothetical protein [Pseudalkalibacillus sp. NRS-1564]|uniref:hypothetical protein n=1 Tax=Pseudalkalibacillus sp. NRS-1564 TaxID=3233900 RepID=UPI003D2996F5
MSKLRRMSRIFHEDGNSISLALDGFNFSTNTAGIDKTVRMLPELVNAGLDSVLVTYGMAKKFEDAFKKVGLVIRVDLSTEIFDPEVPDTLDVFGIEEALTLGADGVVCMTFPGAVTVN